MGHTPCGYIGAPLTGLGGSLELTTNFFALHLTLFKRGTMLFNKFHLIIENHLEFGKPVGSNRISKIYLKRRACKIKIFVTKVDKRE